MNKVNDFNSINKSIAKELKKVAGISVAIVEKGDIIYERYSGYMDKDKRNNNNMTKMMIGSNGKLFTSIAIFQLYEKGLLDLDKDIRDYIEELDIKSDFDDQIITIRNILFHRSGLASDNFDFITNSDFSLEDIIRVVNETPLSTKPNTTYAYSNIGYTLLGLVVQRISKMKFEEYVKENIFDKINSTFEYITDNHLTKNGQYSSCFDNKLNTAIEPLKVMTPAGTCLYGTLNDMVKLMQIFTNVNNQSVLKQETIKMMMTKVNIDNTIEGEYYHGLGLIHNMYNYYSNQVGDILSHGGDTMYHHSRFVLLPKHQAGFIVMTNTQRGLTSSIKLIDIMIKSYFKYKKIHLETRKKARINTIVGSDNSIEGFYTGPNVNLKVYRKNDKLYAKIRFMKMELRLGEDGYYIVVPKGIAQLPPFSFLTKGLFLKFENINGDDIVFAREYYKFKYNSAKIGIKMKTGKEFISEDFLGAYDPILSNENLENFIQGINVIKEGGYVKVRIHIIGVVQDLYITRQDDKTYKVIGFGKYAGDTIKFDKIDNKVQVKLFGLRYHKPIHIG